MPKQRLVGWHSFKTELLQQKTRPGSHPRLPGSRRIPNQQQPFPVGARTSSCPEKASDSSACTRTKANTHLSPLPCSPHPRAKFPTQRGAAPCRQKVLPSSQGLLHCCETGQMISGHPWRRARAQHPHPERCSGRGGAGAALLAWQSCTAQLTRQELCSTWQPSEVARTRLCTSVCFSFTPSELGCQNQHKSPSQDCPNCQE